MLLLNVHSCKVFVIIDISISERSAATLGTILDIVPVTMLAFSFWAKRWMGESGKEGENAD